MKTYASYNNELGYPLTLLRLEPEHRYAVLEMGAEWVGELCGLCETIACPDWSIITIVGSAHLKHFGSRENVAIAKSELVQVLSKEGIALLNYDDPIVQAMKEKTSTRVIFYGKDPQAEVRATALELQGLFGTHFTLCIEQQQVRVKLALPESKYTIEAAISWEHPTRSGRCSRRISCLVHTAASGLCRSSNTS